MNPDKGDIVSPKCPSDWAQVKALLQEIQSDPNFDELKNFMDDRPNDPAPERELL